MPHLLAVVDMIGGAPDVDFQATPVTGHVFIFQTANFGLYMFGGSAAQLTALNALPKVRGLVAMTENETVKWAELDTVITTAVRNKLNTWLTARGYPTIPAGWTYRQVIRALLRRMRGSFGEDTDNWADRILQGTWIM